MILSATYLTGWHDSDTGDFVASTALYTIDGQSVGFASDAIMDLVDNHGWTFHKANATCAALWGTAAASIDHTASLEVTS